MGKQARRYRRHLEEELENAAVYRALAEEATGERREILEGLADADLRHARHWADRLEALGYPRPSLDQPRIRLRSRLLGLLARRVGLGAVIPFLERSEAAEVARYDVEESAPAQMVVDERIHARVLSGLSPAWRRKTSGSLRAAVFGVNDGLVSNLALVMGVAGGQASNEFILLAGLAGLVGGAMSMGIGEWISVTSQRELWAGEVSLDADHLDALPEASTNELALLFRAKGVSPEKAVDLAAAVVEDRERAARVLAHEKLGFDPRTLGSPWAAAISNFSAFAVGATVPVVPFAVASGTPALLAALVAAAVALFAVGAAISLLTYRPLWRAGARQLLIGALAAGVTYGVGALIGGVVA